MILTARTATAAAVLALVAAACGGETNTGTETGPPEVIATTSIWADITSAALCGIDVPALIPVGADPHTFEPSLRDRELIEGAQLVVANGGGLEASLVDLLATAEADGTNLVEMTRFVEVITAGRDIDDDHGIDPHIWQDPNRVIDAVAGIAAAGTALGLAECADDYQAELIDLDDRIDTVLAPLPAERRLMVTSHDSLAYLADRYDMEIVGTVIPSTNTLAQTNAADLAALADVIAERGVPAIFTEQLESTADADALARRLDVAVIPLVTDALTDDPNGDTYLEMMLANATSIAEALSP